MKKLHIKVKISMSILTLLAVSFSFFAFNDSGNYSNDGKVITINNDLMYQVGVINVKFKSQISGFTLKSTGIAGVDRVL